MPKVILINDTSDHLNWGSQACAEGLRNILSEADPSIVFDILTNRWLMRKFKFDPIIAGLKLFGPDNSFRKLFSRAFHETPRVADEYEYLAEEWMRGRGGCGADEYLRKLENADAVVFNAEGSMYRTNYGAVKALFLLWLAKSRYGIPGFFLNGSVTLTPVDPILPAMARKAFSVLDGITVREPFSLRNVESYMPGLDVEMVPDSVFSFGPGEYEVSRPESRGHTVDLIPKPYFCFSLSMLPMDYSRTRSGSAICRLITRLKELVPTAVFMAKDQEDQFLRAVARDTGSLFVGPDYTFREIMRLLKDSQFLFSGRYHHIIMATIVGCPSIALQSTSHKVNGVCELLESCLRQPYDPTSLHECMDTIVDDARRILEEGSNLREKCLTTAASCRQRTGRMGELVTSVLERNSDRPGREKVVQE